jgi:hypothetical protein
MEEINLLEISDVEEIVDDYFKRDVFEKIKPSIQRWVEIYLSKKIISEIITEYDTNIKKEINEKVWDELQEIKKLYLEEIRQLEKEIITLKRRINV